MKVGVELGFPQLIQRPHVAERKRRFKRDLGSCSSTSGQPLGAQQAVEQRVDTAAGFIKTAKRGDGALTRFTFLVAERLDELQVAVAAGASELDEHGREYSHCSRRLPPPQI